MYSPMGTIRMIITSLYICLPSRMVLLRVPIHASIPPFKSIPYLYLIRTIRSDSSSNSSNANCHRSSKCVKIFCCCCCIYYSVCFFFYLYVQFTYPRRRQQHDNDVRWRRWRLVSLFFLFFLWLTSPFSLCVLFFFVQFFFLFFFYFFFQLTYCISGSDTARMMTCTCSISIKISISISTSTSSISKSILLSIWGMAVLLQ